MRDTSTRQPPAARRPGLVLGRVFGIPVHVNASMLLLAVVVTVLYGEFVRRELELAPAAGYAVGLGFVVCLLGSVFLHELGHAVTARRSGIGVRGITLELLGGYTELDRDAPTPKVELLVSLAGPAVSLLLAGAAALVTAVLPGGGLPHELMFQITLSNVVVAVFNVLPGLPLDGGRALRAVVWAASRDRHLGTEAAGWTGRVIALGTAASAALLSWWGLLAPLGTGLTVLVALTLWQGAGQAVRVARMSRRFPLIDLSRLARPVFPVPSGTPLAEGERRAADAGHPVTLGVADSAGRLVAVVDRLRAAAVPAARRPWVPVDSVAQDLVAVPRLAVGTAGERVVRAVQTHPGAQYLVTSGEDVVGVLHVADLAQLLEPKRKMNL